MEEDGESLTPFWLQNSTNLRRVDRYRHRVSSLFFNSGVLLTLLLVTAVFFVAFVIPTTMSFSAQIFRPTTVKKSWESVNLVLVLFALFLGFFSRNRNDDYSNFDNQYQHQSSSSSNSNVANVVSKSNPSTPNKWYEYSDRAAFSDPISTRSMGGLRRNGTSYPDLHLHEVTSPWVAGDDQWRFCDDHHVYFRRRSWKEADKKDIETKNIPVDTFVVSGQEQEASCAPPSPSSPPPPLSPPPPPPPPQRRAVKEKEKKLYRPPSSTPTQPPPSQPPPPPPPPPQRRAAKEKEERMYRSIAHEAKTSENVRNDSEPLETLSPPAAAAPPQPAQHWGIDRKKRDGGNASKDNFLASFYHKKKKKRQRQRSVDNLDAFFNHHSQPPRTQSQAQPAPPSHSVFQNLFSSRKGKRRRIPSDPLPAPPVSPPPFTAARVSKPRMQIQAITNYNPPLPVNIRRINSVNENSSSGGSSPLFPIPPPPPPPPPFKATGWKFVVEGDYVSVQSNPSSRSGSPDPDDVETSSPGGNATSSSPLFCPSPDVDTKADNFIARFRAGLKLEKINSFNKKQGLKMSNLGPRSGPTQI